MPKLTDKDLITIIEGHERNALGGDTGELATDRADALKRYLGEPYGDELEGRSQVISKDFADAVDWIMPNLLRVFISSEFLRFDPVGPEDEKAAEQESDYTNHVIMKENNGFTVLYDWFKDALMLKNGYVKRWWDVSEETTHESYTGITIDELTRIVQEKEAYGAKVSIVGADTQVMADPMSGAQVELFDVKIKCTSKKGRVRIEPVPPDEIRVSNRTRGDLKESVFVQHVTPKRRSELIEMGMKKDFVDELPSWNTEDEESAARDQVNDESTIGGESYDKSTDEIEYKENYVRVDFDGDGIAELRRVVLVGGKLPDGSEWNEECDSIPFDYLTPNRMPHRHVGLSLNDAIEDLARIKTALMRNMLDNAYFINNVEWVINERVNLDDFSVSRPGGFKRVKGNEPVTGSAEPVLKQPFIQHVIPILDYVDQVKEGRTGVGRNVMGLDADTLKETTAGAAAQALQQANAKIEMIARLFAETGVKSLALGVHELLIKHQDKPKQVKLKQNWVPVNPQEWKTRTDMTVSVGIGTGSMEEVRANLMLLAQAQQQAAQAGIVTPRNVYNLAEKMADNLGFKQKGEFFSDPNSPEVKQMQASQKQGNPLAEAEQIKGQVKLQSDQIKQMADAQGLFFEKYKFDKQHALDLAKAEIEALVKGLNVDLGRPGIGAETGAANAPAA
jgi:hypothetical protein